MRYLNKRALGALTTFGLLASGAAIAQHKPAGAPAVAPIGDATPPADLPTGTGPSGTSTTLAGPTRFDRVGYAAIGSGGGIAATGLGLPAAGFAEVTDLATGRTVLVKTMAGAASAPGLLVDLSPQAAHLLGLAAERPAQVRVRQVEPIAADQVALDQGRPAAPRLDAPPILLTGLRAQMAEVPAPAAVHASSSAAPPPAKAVKAPAAKPGAPYSPPGKSTKAVPQNKSKPAAAPKSAAPTMPKPAAGKYQVRVGAFSSAANAKALAAKLGGHVAPSGKYWLVELGPFADAAAAKSARDGAAKRGYGDARVITD